MRLQFGEKIFPSSSESDETDQSDKSMPANELDASITKEPKLIMSPQFVFKPAKGQWIAFDVDDCSRGSLRQRDLLFRSSLSQQLVGLTQRTGTVTVEALHSQKQRTVWNVGMWKICAWRAVWLGAWRAEL
ncbi:unnamed protein product, partial [Mesorhabditis belari]|uniref:Uncharacterized protein n=1 Tax=Mesorhabditis belari TaxID=2138241 RepID=A0AAF3FKV5_9BILA